MIANSFFSTKMTLDNYINSNYPLPVWADVPNATTHIEYVVADNWVNWHFFAGSKAAGSVISTM